MMDNVKQSTEEVEKNTRDKTELRNTSRDLHTQNNKLALLKGQEKILKVEASIRRAKYHEPTPWYKNVGEFLAQILLMAVGSLCVGFFGGAGIVTAVVLADIFN